MLFEWLDIASKLKCDEMIEVCEQETDDLYQELIAHLNEFKEGSIKDNIEFSNRLENLFILKTRRDVQFIFNIALKMGIEIGQKIK